MDTNPTARAWKATPDFDSYLSGDYEEHVFGVDRGEFRCVLFSDEDGIEQWVGRFSADGFDGKKVCCFEYRTQTQVHRLGDGPRFQVLAGGHLYVVDASRRTLESCLYIGDFVGLLIDPVRSRFVAWDYSFLIILDGAGGEIYRRELSCDDYYDMQLWPDAVTGVAWVNYVEYRRFEFNLDTFKVTWKDCVEPEALGFPG